MRARMDARCVCKSVYTRECVSHVYESVYTTLCVEDYACIYIYIYIDVGTHVLYMCVCVCIYILTYILIDMYMNACLYK
jgi:hypothetical protein